jgi:hypothetical protein
MVAEIDSIEAILARRKAADEEWWKGAKAKLDEKARLEEEQAKKSSLPFLEQRFGKRGSAAISEGLIGGAFPLLFGQGLGASVLGGAGGALGGFAGGGLGFGLSLIGTALGTAFDTFNQAAQDTGRSLNYPIEGFNKLKDAGLFASRQQEYYISKLIESGQTTRATAEIQAEMIRKIGVSGVNDLAMLGDASSNLSKVWAEFNLQLQAALAGPMAGLLQWVAAIVASGNRIRGDIRAADEVEAGLSGAALKRFQERRNEIVGLTRKGLAFGGIMPSEAARRQAALAEEFRSLAKPPSLVPETAKQDPAQQEADLRKQIQAAQEIRSLQQQGADIQRSAAELRLGIEDTIYGFRRRAEDIAREGVELRRSMENEIFSKRQDLDRQIIENDRKRQQNAIDAFDIQLQKASIGIDPIARGIVDAGRDYFRVVAEALADKEQSEKQLALDIAKINRDADQYSLEVEDRISQMTRQREEFSRDVSKAKTQAEYQIQDYIVKVEQYRLEMAQRRVDLALQEANGIAKATQIAAGVGLFDSTPGSVVGGAVGLQQAIERIRGAYSFRGTTLAKNKRPGDYQSDPRENFFFDFQSRSVIDAAKKRVNTLTDRDIAALALTVLTEAGPTNVGKMDVAANLITRSAMKGGAPISAIAAAPGQYEGVFKRGLTPGQLENPAVGRRLFGAAYDRVASMFTGGAKAPAANGNWFTIPAGFPGAQAPVDRYGLTIGAKAATTTQAASAAPGIGTFVGGGTTAASAQSIAKEMAMPTPPTAPAIPDFPSAPALIKVNDLQEKNNELAKESIRIRKAGSEAERESIANRIEEAQLAVVARARAPIDAIQEQTQSILDDIETRKLRNRLLIEGVNPAIVEGGIRIAEITKTSNRLIAEQDKLLASLIGVQYDGTTATYEMALARLKELEVMQPGNVELEKERLNLEGILRARQGILDATGGAVAGAADAAALEALPGQRIQGFIAEATAELNNLESVAISVSQGIGDAVGSSIANAIAGLTEGTTTARELFSSFLRDIGQILIQEGTKMIATYVAIGIAKMFAGLSSGASAGSSGATNAISKGKALFAIPRPAANGAYFDAGVAAFAMGAGFGSPRLHAFANGGTFTNSIVSSPTLFKFADGAAIKTGVMGEAGPEAVMPLDRGPDGRLGVRASGLREAMGAAPGSPVGAPVLNMSFEATTIGGVEYVSRDQLEAAMAETRRAAANDGAKKGMTMTLDKIQNSGSTRRRIGV